MSQSSRKVVQHIQAAPDGLSLVLPRRTLGIGNLICAFLFILGISVFLSAILFAAVLTGFIPPSQVIPPLILIPGMFLAVFLAPPTIFGFLPFWWGAAGLFGHRQIDLLPASIRTSERWGPFTRSKIWPTDALHSLELRPLSTGTLRSNPPPIDFFAPFNALLIHSIESKRGVLAWGYTEELLGSVAREIAAFYKSLNRAEAVRIIYPRPIHSKSPHK